MTRRPAVTAGLPERMLTVAEAASQLGVDKSMVYDWIRAGRLPSVQYPSVGTGGSRGARRIRQSAVTQFLADCERT